MWDKITGAEEAIWVYEGGSNKMLKKMHNEYFHDLYSSAKMLSDKIMAYELDRVCDMYEGEEKCIQAFGEEN
jgi:hypothetical protein